MGRRKKAPAMPEPSIRCSVKSAKINLRDFRLAASACASSNVAACPEVAVEQRIVPVGIRLVLRRHLASLRDGFDLGRNAARVELVQLTPERLAILPRRQGARTRIAARR